MIKSINEIEEVVLKIKHIESNGGIILLKGDLASGKTTLVKAFVKLLGIPQEATSPTFSIMNIYDDKVYHYDIYNEGTAKFLESGLLENLEKEGYHFIEWADEKLEEILKAYGFDYITVEIIPEGVKRRYRIG
ncbi:MAG: tRNA (adenosine(37)-N6)-threonylcarbamoyltransferase complex ATPase subunit type 1 TsaE [Sulfurospirillum sp.]|nr:MAG: tRNA (adenosine(37)-N6)-threonylcarbamoyltransferase complex ATPase subunit type 1 TsaE [Sulfurospirillum sp.]